MAARLCTGLIIVVLLAAAPGMAIAASGRIYVTNEKSSNITVLDGKSYKVVRSFKTCKRPRGVHFSKDRKQFYVGCADDNVIAVYETATAKLVKRIRGIEEPETFDLAPDGEALGLFNPVSAASAQWVLALASVSFLALGMWVFSRKEYD